MKSLYLPIALVLSLVTIPAMAADLPVRMPVKAAPAPVIAPYNWTGFYIGAHVGGAWGTKDWFGTQDFFTPGVPLGSHDVSSFVGGGQLGFNWQAPGSNWVLGVEGQASWAADLKGEHIAGGDEVLQTKVKWLATVAPRLGYAWDRALLYAKGGVAFAGDKHTHFDTDAPTVVFVGDKIRTGWMVGGGVEVALSGNWTAKGEYNFMDFGKKDITFSAPSDSFPIGVEQKIHLVKFGINYRFGSSAPVAARY